MSSEMPSIEASTYDLLVRTLRHTEDWPIKAGSFAVPATLDQRFANKAEDGLRKLFNASTEVDCRTRPSGFTEVMYRVDYTYAKPEESPQESDIVIDPTIEKVS